MTESILVVNAGSSSVKLALFTRDDTANPPFMAAGGTTVSSNGPLEPNVVIQRIDELTRGKNLGAIGHRLVHGGPKYSRSVKITGDVIQDLATLAPFDPDHTPNALTLIEHCAAAFPDAAQYACFDTAFFHDIPRVAQLLPLPRRYQEEGLRRYGFHGLSYTYLQQAFHKEAGEAAVNGRVIYAHLGSGASLAATLHGKPIDTTMSFTPASGLVMSSRSGDLDPGIAWYLHKQHQITPEAFNRMVNTESGLLGVSGLTADMKSLIDTEATNEHAAEAVELFCYRVVQAIGALTATIGGLDSLVFSGGIGEQSHILRQRICERLSFLGITVDQGRNQSHATLISADDSSVGVHVIPTDEAYIIASQVATQLMNGDDHE